MKTLKPVDIVIIGGGWTGLTMAKELTARTPLSVLVLNGGARGRPPTTQSTWMRWTTPSATV